MPNNVVLTEFKGDASSFISAVNSMQAAINQLNTSLGTVNVNNQQVATSTTKVGAAQKTATASTIALGGVMAKLALNALAWGKSMASSFAETGVHVRKLQEVMGGTAEDMSRLLAVFGAYKIPFDAIVVSYRTFAIQATTNTKAFKEMGLSLHDVNGVAKTSMQLFGEAADKLAKVDNATTRTALAGVLFGRRYKELLPVLALGSEGMKKVAENADKLGIVLDEAGVKKAVEFTQTQTQMHQAMQGLTFVFMQEVVPALSKVLQWFTGLIVAFKDYLNTNPAVVKGFLFVAGALGTLYVATKAVAVAQALLTGVGALAAIGRATAAFGSWVAFTVFGYGSVATAASAAAAASLSAWAATGIGLVVVGAAVAGVAVLVTKMMNNIKGAKLDLPKFTGFGTGGTDQYDLTTPAKADKTNTALDRAKKHLEMVKKFWEAQVKAAKEALDATKEQAQKYEDYIKKIGDEIKKSAEIPDMIGESFAKYLGPGNLVRLFQQKIADAREFLADLKALKAANLDPVILGQLAAQGPQAGLESARVIMSDMSVIGELNGLQAQLTDIASQTGAAVGQYVMPTEYAAAQALPAAQAAYTAAQAGQTRAVGAAQHTVNNITTNVHANTNANPQHIAQDVAWVAATHLPSGRLRGKYIPLESKLGPGVTMSTNLMSGPDDRPNPAAHMTRG